MFKTFINRIRYPRHPLCAAHIPARCKLVSVYVNNDDIDCAMYAEPQKIVAMCNNQDFARKALEKKGLREIWVATEEEGFKMISFR